MEMEMKDEDYEYEKYRQQQLDELGPEKWKMMKDTSNLIGRALRDAEKVQKYARHDPAPELPFEEDMDKPDYLLGFWLTIVGLVLIGLAVMYGGN